MYLNGKPCLILVISCLCKIVLFTVMTVSARSLFSAAVAGRPAANSREQLRRPHTLILSWTNLLCLTEQQISEQLISDVRYRFCLYWNRTELSELSELNITCVWTCNSRTQVLDTFMLMKTGYKCLVLEIWLNRGKFAKVSSRSYK